MRDVSPPVMMLKGYQAGTHRLIAPEETLARVRPHLANLEVTRLADLTGLDRIGIPVYCAVRPTGLILQSTNGKGARAVDAQASALMEAVEHHHAERLLPDVVRASARALGAEGDRVVMPHGLAQYRAGTYWSDDFVIEWAPATDLVTGARAWLPASAVYSGTAPCLHDFTANGLASGNHLTEATLHAIYEILERDAVSRLSADGRIRLGPPACRVVDTKTLEDTPRDLCRRLDAADVSLVLLAIDSVGSIPTFWAVLIDRAPFSASSTVNVGYGTHLSPTVAAIRAITEAAQSRVCYIHGAREDLASKMGAHSEALLRSIAGRFERLVPDSTWNQFVDVSSHDLHADFEGVVRRLTGAGVPAIYRVDLTRAPFNLPVVKVVMPGMRLNRRFF